MSLRRIAALLLALAAACAKDVSPEASPAFVDYAVFDPSTGQIPLPNDLALASAAGLADGAQKDLLLAFAAAGGFPNDIEVPITIDFVREAPGRSGSTRSVPELDVATVTPSTVSLLEVGALGSATVVPFDVAGYVQGPTKGTLTLRAQAGAGGARLWKADAQYILAVRGGPNGVKTVGGGMVRPMPTMFLLLQGKNLADPANQALLPDPSAGAQLEELRQNYLGPFSVVDGNAPFHSRELAVLQTFKIAPAAGTYVRVDQTAGVVPLPFDLLRTDADGTVILNAGFGPAAPGLDTLDGFSTTAMMLAPTSGPIDAATVNAANVFLFRLPQGGAPVLVRDLAGALGVGQPGQAVYVTQPPDINQACGIASGSCSTVIGLQPAVPAAVPGLGTFYLPPLEEDSEYAVVVTNGVKDVTGAGLTRSTLAKILLQLTHPASVGGASQLAGIDDATAAMIDHIRGQVDAVLAAGLPGGKTRADVAMAYTFKTQSVTGVSLQLSAFPYGVEQGAGAAVFVPAGVAVLDVATTFGIPKGPDVDAFYTMNVPSVDAIDPTTGALRPDLAELTPAQMAALVRPLPALVAVPVAANIPNCPPPVNTLKCAKLVLFHHGLGGGHLQMIQFANALAAQGFIVAAIDFPLHGDRAPCSTAADCNAGGTCDPIAGAAGQGDAAPPGVCSNGNLLNASLTSVASGRYFISANFFRSRDAFRQDLVDQSALGLALARPPFPLAYQPASDPFTAALLAMTPPVVVDPSAIYFEGISLGGIAGTEILATNPRVTRGALSVPGGTLTDVFTTAPAFSAQVDALFLSLGIDRSQIATDPVMAARYLQTVNVVKWILDPGDPINFAKHVSLRPLPNLLAGGLQPAKEAWGQLAQGDLVVPNPSNRLLFANGAIPFTHYTSNGGDAPHGLLAVSGTAQADAALWLRNQIYPGVTKNVTDVP